MDWWFWLILVVALVAVLAGSFLGVQARRRSGGVIVTRRTRSKGKGTVA
ncbi:hypothetical protein [Streptomyces sp. NPDC048002]